MRLPVLASSALVIVVAVALTLTLRGPDRAIAQEEPGTGRAIYLRDCAVCHGVGGRGTSRGPDLRDVGAASVDFYVRTGRMPIDPTEHPPPSPERKPPQYAVDEIRALVRYVETFVDGPAIPSLELGGADLAAGAERYFLDCAGCHQSIGTGGALAYGRNAPSLSDAAPIEVAEAVRVGPGTMPAFPPDLLDERELSDLVAYVDEIRSPRDRGGWSIGHFGPVSEGLVAWGGGLFGAVLVARWLGTRARDELDP